MPDDRVGAPAVTLAFLTIGVQTAVALVALATSYVRRRGATARN